MSIPQLPDKSQTLKFKKSLSSIVSAVTKEYRLSADLLKLKGQNSLESLDNAQLHLGRTLLSVFEYSNVDMHIRILPWVYRSYKRHGYFAGYFAATLKLWIKAVSSEMDEPDAYIPYLKYLLDLDQQMAQLSDNIPETHLKDIEGSPYSAEELNELLRTLVADDLENSEKLLARYYNRENRLFWDYVIHPVMYEVGRLWELDYISVDDEHRISAVISGFIASVHKRNFKKTRHRILITPAPNEYHEIGALLLAEEFRQADWAVSYLNAGASIQNIIDFADQHKPDIIAISAASILHASNLFQIVGSLKMSHPEIPVILGGKFVNENLEIITTLAAAGGASSPKEAIELVKRILK